jgi:glycosyltransferase involved in cell wall biosynthesis
MVEEKRYQSWSIFIFCYNEQGNIQKVIRQCADLLEKFHCNENELIVVNDGSTDNSLKEIEEMQKEFPFLNIINHKKNKGIGGALISGYKACKNENICAVPGDGQFDISELLPFENIENKTIVSFYREKNEHYHPFRKMLSWINKFVNAYFMGIKIKDVNWIKVYKKSGLEKINIELNSSLVESEIFAKMIILGYSPLEVVSEYKKRDFGITKGASFQTLTLALKELLKLIVIVNRFKNSN